MRAIAGILFAVSLALTALDCAERSTPVECPPDEWRAHRTACRLACDDDWGDSECTHACETNNDIEGCHD